MIDLEAGKDVTLHFFVKFPKDVTGSAGSRDITLDFIRSLKTIRLRLRRT